MTREERLFNIMISVGRGVWLLDESRQLICSISLSLSPAATRAQLLERRAAGLITVSYLNLSLSPQHYTSVSHIYSLLGLRREARRRTNCWTGTESVAGGYCGEVLSDGRRHINVSESEEAVAHWASHHHQHDGSRDGEVELFPADEEVGSEGSDCILLYLYSDRCWPLLLFLAGILSVSALIKTQIRMFCWRQREKCGE